MIEMRRVVACSIVVLVGATVAAGARQAAPAGAVPPAPTEGLPSAAEVLSRYTRAIGGERMVRKYRSRRTIGRFELRAQGIAGPLEIVAAPPDRVRVRIVLAGLGEMLRGYDGKIGWAVDPAIGPRVLSERELEETQYSADYYADLYSAADYASMTVVSRGPFEGRDCFAVKLVRPSGFESLEYFDTKSGLRIGVRMASTSMMGTVPDVVTVFGEYRDFGGLLTPVTATERAMGFESLLTVERIEYDNVKDEELRPPAAIAALAR